MSSGFKGMAGLEAMQWLAVAFLVLLLLLSSSIRLGGAFGNVQEMLDAQMLAMNVAGRLDSFQRNACGEGACSTTFAVGKPDGFSLHFLPSSVSVETQVHSAIAKPFFPLDALGVYAGETGGKSVIFAGG